MSNPLLERHGWTTRYITANYQIIGWGQAISAACSSANITVTLYPVDPASKQNNGEVIVIKTDNTAFKVLIVPSVGNTLNGGTAAIELTMQGDCVKFWNDDSGNITAIVYNLHFPNGQFLQFDTSSPTGIRGAIPASSFDATAGVGGNYATVAAAIAAGKKAINVVGLATEVSDVLYTSDLYIQVNSGVIWDMGDFQIQNGNANSTLYVNTDGTIKWTPTTSKSLFDGLTNGGTFNRGVIVIDGSSSTVNDCPLYSNFTSVSSFNKTIFYLPNQNGWGIHQDTTTICFEKGVIVFLNIGGVGTNIYNLLTNTASEKSINEIIVGGGMSVTNNLFSSSGEINKISRSAISAPELMNVLISGSLNGCTLPTGFDLNITMGANNAKINNCNLNAGDIDINSKNNIVLSNIVCNDVLNINSTTTLSVVKRAIDSIPLLENVQLYQDINSIVTAAGTTVLTNASKVIQQFTGTMTQIVTLPDATTLLESKQYQIQNESTRIITVNYNGGSLLTTVAAGTDILLTLSNNSTTDGIWHISQLIGDNTVTNAKLAQMPTNTIKGNNTGGTANALDLTVAQVTSLISSTTPIASTIPQWDTSKNLRANNMISDLTSTATAAGTTTLTITSTQNQRFTGTTTQTIILPDATSLIVGTSFNFQNESTGILTIQNAIPTTITTVAANSDLTVVLAINGSTAGTWHVQPASSVTSSSTPTANTISKWNTNVNFSANNFLSASTSIATAAGTTTLTVTSTNTQVFTGSTTQTVVLPNATTLVNGTEYFIINQSTGNITVNANGGTLIETLTALNNMRFILTNNSSAAGVWALQSNKTPKVTIFTNSGTWTPDPYAIYSRIQCQGAGGSSTSITGVSGSLSISASGGSGAYIEAIFPRLTSAQSVTVGTCTLGSNGGTTSVGSLIVASGGTAGSATTTGLIAGNVFTGTATVAATSVPTQAGGTTIVAIAGKGVSRALIIAIGANSSAIAIIPDAASSYLGQGGFGGSAYPGIATSGEVGLGYGGGGGGSSASGISTATGKLGSGGIVIVTEYYS